MLCRRIDDPVESGAGGVDGLGLLDADIVFAPDKTLRHHEAPLRGYEIHHGQVARCAEDDWLGVGIRRGAVYGTHWHGLLDNDDVRRRWLTDAAAAAGRRDSPSPTTSTSRPTRRPTRPDGRPAGRPRRHRRDPRAARTPDRPSARPIDQRAAWVAWAHDPAAAWARLRWLWWSRRSPRARTPSRAPRPGRAPRWNGSLLTAEDFPSGVQYRPPHREPGQPDGAGGPPRDAVATRGLLRRADQGDRRVGRTRARAARRSTASAYDGARIVMTVLSLATWIWTGSRPPPTGVPGIRPSSTRRPKAFR